MKEQRNFALFFSLALVINSACSKQPPTQELRPSSFERTTPDQVIQISRKALGEKNIAEFKSVLSRKTLEGLAAQGDSVDAAIEAMMETVPDNEGPIPPVETRNERIEGNAATIETSYGNGKWATEFFVLEDGEWKLHLFKRNSDPRNALRTLAEALKNREVMFFKSLVSARLMADTRRRVEIEGKSPDAALGELIDELTRVMPEDVSEYSDSKQEDDRAKFTYRVPSDELRPVTFYLAREENGWKLDRVFQQAHIKEEGRLEVPPELLSGPKPRTLSRVPMR